MHVSARVRTTRRTAHWAFDSYIGVWQQTFLGSTVTSQTTNLAGRAHHFLSSRVQGRLGRKVWTPARCKPEKAHLDILGRRGSCCRCCFKARSDGDGRVMTGDRGRGRCVRGRGGGAEESLDESFTVPDEPGRETQGKPEKVLRFPSKAPKNPQVLPPPGKSAKQYSLRKRSLRAKYEV